MVAITNSGGWGSNCGWTRWHTHRYRWVPCFQCLVKRVDNPEIGKDIFDKKSRSELWCEYDSQGTGLNSNNRLSNDAILLFLRENETTENEKDWIKSHEKLNEVEVLKLLGEIMLNKASS
jgi:hypothetical protein